VAEVVAAVEKYGKAYRRHLDVKNVRKTAEAQEPGKLDLAPLAAKYNFPIGETPLVDRYEVANYEIGQKAQELDREALQMMRQIRMLTFADIAFGANERSAASQQPLYKPEEVRSSEPGDVSYVYFRTAEEKSADVTLKEVQPQVVAFWKRQKAFELTMAEAKKMAEKAKDLASIGEFAPDPLSVVVTEPFSWMSSAGFGMFGRPELTQVPKINLPGQEFMKAVFALQPGQTGEAPNQAHSKVYVVKVQKQDPDDDRLRSLFLDSGYNQLVIMLAQMDAGQTSYEWYRGIAKQYNVKWHRPPQEQMQM
jgi:ribosomal protein L7/L12